MDPAVGEAPFIAPFLVPVEGYRYANASAAEYEGVQEQNDSIEADSGFDFFGAVSLKSVVADDPSENTAQAWNGDWEVGYLALVQLNLAVPFGANEQFAINFNGGESPIDDLDIASVSVYVFDNPDMPDSRFTYSWLDHGVFGFIDGADREPLERWLNAYLAGPKLADHETEELAARLIAVSGFTYSNADTATLAEMVMPLGDVGYSMHKVADSDGSIGNLTLVAADDPEFLGGWVMNTLGLAPSGEVGLGAESAGHFFGVVDGEQRHALAWTEEGIGGVLTTNPADLETAERFLKDFVLSHSTSSDVVDVGSSAVAGAECPEVGVDRSLPLFDDFEGDCRIIDVNAEAGQTVQVVDGSMEVLLDGSDWVRWVDLDTPVDELSVSLSADMPPEGLLQLWCYGPQPSLDAYQYTVLTTPTEVGFALHDDPEGPERPLLNRDVVPREEIAEPMHITFTCKAESSAVNLAGQADWAVLEASVGPADEPSPSFQAIAVRLIGNEEQVEPVTFTLDNLSVTE